MCAKAQGIFLWALEGQLVQKLEKLRKIVDNIPTEILTLYNDANLSRKETLSHE